MKRILVLGSHKAILEELKQSGFFVIACDVEENLYNIDLSRKDYYFDEFIPLPSEKLIEFIDKNKKFDVDLVLAPTEMKISYWSRVAKKLSLPHPPANSLELVRDKYLLKNKLSELKYISPSKIIKIESNTTYEEIRSHVGIPFVVKPRDLMGFCGVNLIENKKQYNDHMSLVGIYSNKWMAESFINGSEFAADIFLFPSGEARCFFAKYVMFDLFLRLQHSDLPSARGNIIPVIDDNVKNLTPLLIKLCKDLGFDYGTFHIEFFLNNCGITIGEVAYRLPGGNLPYLNGRLYGMNYNQLYLASHGIVSIGLPAKQVLGSSLGNLYIYCNKDVYANVRDFTFNYDKADFLLRDLIVSGMSKRKEPYLELLLESDNSDHIYDCFHTYYQELNQHIKLYHEAKS